MADDNAFTHRQSILSKTSRRSTFYRPNVQEPPVSNPDNSDEYNAHLKKEYEQLQLVNRAIEITISDLQRTVKAQKQLAEHVDDTDRLLNLWSTILEKTEEYKQVLENPDWEKW